MSVKIECKLEDIRKALNYLRVALPKHPWDRKSAMMEIFFLPNEIRFSVIGATYKLPISTGFYKKVILPFAVLDKIAMIYPNINFSIQFDEGVVTYDNKTVPNKNIMMVDPEAQATLELTMNFSEVDLLLLEYLYLEEDLKRMKLTEKIEEAKDNYERALQNAYDLLSDYGVKYEELKSFVMSKMFKKKFCF